MQLTENSISPDSALIKIRTPKRANFDHRDVRREGICGTEDLLILKTAYPRTAH